MALPIAAQRTRSSPRSSPRPLPRLRDELRSLARLHELWLAPIDRLDGAERLTHDPTVVRKKADLERRYLQRLAEATARELPEVAVDGSRVIDAVGEIRALAARDQVPAVYEWLATEADRSDMVRFLTLEGGPDADFDDLVALCQVGLAGEPKLEMARNYWDEMGGGRAEAVHTELYRAAVAALGLEPLEPTEVPVAALERSVLGGVLATNRSLQPEMVGALGLIELQAGPRCRKVVQGLRRVGAPEAAVAFYEEHATADPRHGKDWLDHVVAELARSPRWAAGMVRGAAWRWVTNQRFLAVAGPVS